MCVVALVRILCVPCRYQILHAATIFADRKKICRLGESRSFLVRQQPRLGGLSMGMPLCRHRAARFKERMPLPHPSLHHTVEANERKKIQTRVPDTCLSKPVQLLHIKCCRKASHTRVLDIALSAVSTIVEKDFRMKRTVACEPAARGH